jgi:hypothetical protein
MSTLPVAQNCSMSMHVQAVVKSIRPYNFLSPRDYWRSPWARCPLPADRVTRVPTPQFPRAAARIGKLIKCGYWRSPWARCPLPLVQNCSMSIHVMTSSFILSLSLSVPSICFLSSTGPPSLFVLSVFCFSPPSLLPFMAYVTPLIISHRWQLLPNTY